MTYMFLSLSKSYRNFDSISYLAVGLFSALDRHVITKSFSSSSSILSRA